MDIGGKYAGTSAGLINTIGNMGNAFQPVIGALIFRAFGWDILFVIYSLASIADGWRGRWPALQGPEGH